MIVNVLSVLMLFLAAISIVLSLLLGSGSLWLLMPRGQAGRTVQGRLERRVPLLLLLAVVLLIVRLLSWPLFYGTLQSFVRYVPGAMCIYGVTQLQPHLSLILQVVKPAVFFLIGGWLILHLLDSQTNTNPWMRTKLYLLALISLFVLGDGVADAYYFTHTSQDTAVSCCTTAFDVASRPTAAIAGSVFGPDAQAPLWVGYYGLQIGLIAWLISLRYRKELVGKGHLGLLSLTALLNVGLSGLALVEVITPRLLGLPHHHDPYDLLGSLPDAFLFFGGFIVGSFAIGWASWLRLMKPHAETVALLPIALRRLLELASVGLSLSLTMVTWHVVVSFW